MTSLKVVEDYLVLEREECLIRTLAALHPRLLADATDPLVPAGGCVSLAASPSVRPEPGGDVVAASKERAGERDLLPRRRGGRPRGFDPAAPRPPRRPWRG